MTDWTIVHGDSLAVLRTLQTACIDAVVTDPPYSSGGAFRSDRAKPASEKYPRSNFRDLYTDFGGDSRDQRSFGYWSALWLSECFRVAKPGSPICVFTDWRQLPTTTDALQAGGWTWRGVLVWDKTESCRPAMGRFSSQAEYIVWGSSGPLPERTEVGCLHGVVRAPVLTEEKHHIAGKPVPVMQHVVGICAPEGRVLDPFVGSASTGVACLRSGRSFYGIDHDPHWVEVARKRMTAEQAGSSLQAASVGQEPLFRG